MHYFETVHTIPGDTFPTITAHTTFDEAIQFAEDHAIPTIHENGGNWDDYEKCWFCGDWFPVSELTDTGECETCRSYFKSRGEA